MKRITKEKMLEVIYEKIADKTLSFGCKVEIEYDQDHHCYSDYVNIDKNTYWKQDEYGSDIEKAEDYEIDKDRTIWHPVLIWDVLDYKDYDIKSWNDDDWDLIKNIIYFWKEKRKPIENQSEECIEYIYNLINKNE